MGATESKVNNGMVCISRTDLAKLGSSPDCNRALDTCAEIVDRLKARVQALEADLAVEKRTGRRLYPDWTPGPIELSQGGPGEYYLNQRDFTELPPPPMSDKMNKWFNEGRVANQ